MFLRNTLLAAYMIIFCGSLIGQNETTERKPWVVKTGFLAAITSNYSFEVERSFGGRISLAAKLAIINPTMDRLNGGRIDGYFFKVGPKFYLSKEKGPTFSGFAIQAQILYTRWHDWEDNGRCGDGLRWEHSIGGLLSGSYSVTILNRVRIEPFVSIGFAPTWEQTYFCLDHPPLTANRGSWWLFEKDDPYKRNYNFSHYSFLNNFALSGGLQIGYTF